MPDQTIFTPFFLDKPLQGLDDLVQSDWIVNRPDLPQGDVQQRMLALYEPLAVGVETAVRAGKRPVSMAGDCCASLGMLAGLQRAQLDPKLIWFDAHGDFNTWATSPSGFLGGMPLAWLVGRGEQTIAQDLGLNSLYEGKVTLTDARDLDPLEAEAVTSSAMSHLELVTDLDLGYLDAGTSVWVGVGAKSNNDFDTFVLGYEIYQVPEPSILALLGIGLAGVGFTRRRMKCVEFTA